MWISNFLCGVWFAFFQNFGVTATIAALAESLSLSPPRTLTPSRISLTRDGVRLRLSSPGLPRGLGRHQESRAARGRMPKLHIFDTVPI